MDLFSLGVFMSAISRNKELLKSVLRDGLSYPECATKYQLTNSGSVSGAVRSILDMLREHTDIEIESNASYAYVVQHKEKLLRYLDKPMPKVNIVPAVKAYLKKKFGKYYASMPEKAAEDWDEMTKVFTHYRHERERYSVRHESAILLVAESATEKVLTQHISYPALGRLQ